MTPRERISATVTPYCRRSAQQYVNASPRGSTTRQQTDNARPRERESITTRKKKQIYKKDFEEVSHKKAYKFPKA